jgi:cell division protein ZapA
MAGVMVVDELNELQKKMRGLEADLENLRTSRDKVLSKSDVREKAVLSGLNEAANRLEKLAQKLSGLS